MKYQFYGGVNKVFENIRKCLDEFEETINKANTGLDSITKEDEDILNYFNLNLAKALMKDWESEKIAKIILAAKWIN